MTAESLKQLFVERAKHDAASVKTYWDRNKNLAAVLNSLQSIKISGFGFDVQRNDYAARTTEEMAARRDGKKYCAPLYGASVVFWNKSIEKGFKRLDLQVNIDGEYKFYDFHKDGENPVAVTTNQDEAAGILRQWALDLGQKRVQELVAVPA